MPGDFAAQVANMVDPPFGRELVSSSLYGQQLNVTFPALDAI